MRQGWEIKKLGEVLKLEYGKPLSGDKRIPDGKYPIYGANGETFYNNMRNDVRLDYESFTNTRKVQTEITSGFDNPSANPIFSKR